MRKYKSSTKNWLAEQKFYQQRLDTLQSTIRKLYRNERIDEYFARGDNGYEKNSRPWFLDELRQAKDCLKSMYHRTNSNDEKVLIKRVLIDTGESLFAKGDGVSIDGH